ncbi:hypothetical protein GJ496_009839 [Pomphorhynchus laevis]|nr:hypothetical protein GJ496_009839 [Pomphorhynchus laevis]
MNKLTKKPVKSDKVRCTDKSTYFTELAAKCDKLDLQQHPGCNKRGISKGGKVQKEQTNALGVDLSRTESPEKFLHGPKKATAVSDILSVTTCADYCDLQVTCDTSDCAVWTSVVVPVSSRDCYPNVSFTCEFCNTGRYLSNKLTIPAKPVDVHGMSTQTDNYDMPLFPTKKFVLWNQYNQRSEKLDQLRAVVTSLRNEISNLNKRVGDALGTGAASSQNYSIPSSSVSNISVWNDKGRLNSLIKKSINETTINRVVMRQVATAYAIKCLEKDAQRQHYLIVVNLSNSGNDRYSVCSILKAINIPILQKLVIRRLPQNELSSLAWLKVTSTPDFVKSVLKAAPKLRHIQSFSGVFLRSDIGPSERVLQNKLRDECRSRRINDPLRIHIVRGDSIIFFRKKEVAKPLVNSLVDQISSSSVAACSSELVPQVLNKLEYPSLQITHCSFEETCIFTYQTYPYDLKTRYEWNITMIIFLLVSAPHALHTTTLPTTVGKPSKLPSSLVHAYDIDEEDEDADEEQLDEMEIINSPDDADLHFHITTDVEHVGNNIDDDVVIPPDNNELCSVRLERHIAGLYQKVQQTGKDMNASIQNSKDFRNPSIYEKLLSHLGIDEYGSNFPPSIYSPRTFSNDSFYEELSKAQKIEMDKWLGERQRRVVKESSTENRKLKKSRFGELSK